jgi:hypothetical protein
MQDDVIKITAIYDTATTCANCGKFPNPDTSMVIVTKTSKKGILFCDIQCLFNLIKKKAKDRKLNSQLKNKDYLSQLGYN